MRSGTAFRLLYARHTHAHTDLHTWDEERDMYRHKYKTNTHTHEHTHKHTRARSLSPLGGDSVASASYTNFRRLSLFFCFFVQYTLSGTLSRPASFMYDVIILRSYIQVPKRCAPGSAPASALCQRHPSTEARCSHDDDGEFAPCVAGIY